MVGFLCANNFGLVLLLMLLIIVYVWYNYKLLRNEKKSDQRPLALPGGGMGWPFLGETLDFLKPHNSNSIGTFLEQHCQR